MPTNYGNWVNITQTYSPTHLEITVPLLHDKMGVDVKLYLASSSKGEGEAWKGITLQPRISSFYPLKYQYKVGDKHLYATVLGNKNLPRSDHYYGYIEARDPETQSSYFERIHLNLIANPLHEASAITWPDQNSPLTYMQLLERMFSRNFSTPYPVRNEDGKLVMELMSGPVVPLVFKDSKNGGALPAGSYVQIFDKASPACPVPVNGQTRIELLPTDKNGFPKGMVNCQTSLLDGQGSYAYIGGIASGQYYAKAYWGEKEIGGPVFFAYPGSAGC